MFNKETNVIQFIRVYYNSFFLSTSDLFQQDSNKQTFVDLFNKLKSQSFFNHFALCVVGLSFVFTYYIRFFVVRRTKETIKSFSYYDNIRTLFLAVSLKMLKTIPQCARPLNQRSIMISIQTNYIPNELYFYFLFYKPKSNFKYIKLYKSIFFMIKLKR